MIKYFDAHASSVSKLVGMRSGCWISMIDPTEEEIAFVCEHAGVEADAILPALDEEERSRIEIEDNYTLILVDIPTTEEKNNKQVYITIPLGIVVTKDYIITVCTEENAIFSHFEKGRIKNFYSKMKTRFILQILYRNASLYLQYLRSINKKSEIVEKRLHHATENKELIQLMELERSLLYFSTSLKGNQVVLDRLQKVETIKLYEEDEDLLEDTIIENNQAIEMANIYSGVLSGMCDTFASIISNNLNVVMRILAVVTIVMSIPTMVFSAYGMNVSDIGMPFSRSPWGFLIIISICVVLSVIVALVFIKFKRFK